ncbi:MULTISPECIES: aromatic ring-hydroxylating oxygenase subunit alpha [Leisingera]|uniref:aromatic ring-hydroxylating oxygenase subunit alpha n=1 Tax=Leisingera TaxID=191028 RepID=UPI001C950A1B|nr:MULTISPECIES: aromatic ring-hydroxylating dioxygenase subunit alpha [Leisingera]MBY6058743.1 aromatic ring-hydroxylating dioxygenase subunit alpha [Leisingera daeponensis]
MTKQLRKSPVAIETFDASTLEAAEVIALPSETFSSEEFFDFEMNAVWGHEWFCVGHASDIPKAGDYYTIQVGKDPMIVLRNRDGGVNVLANVCQHRGMILAEGSGSLRRLRCPLHAWTYDLSGKLIAAPGLTDGENARDLSDICLPKLRTEIWEGFIFVTYDESLPPVSDRLGKLGRQLENYRMAELRAPEPLKFEEFDWNWKIFNDECYHCMYLHSNSWGDMYALDRGETLDEQVEFNDVEKGITSYNLCSTHVDAAPTHTKSILQPPIPGLTEQERSQLSYVTVAPNLLIVAMPDKVKYFMWLPVGAQKSLYGVSWMYPESTLARPDFHENFDREVKDLGPVMEEDIYAWRSCQAGYNSSFANRGPLAPEEEVIKRLQTWLVGKYRAEQARATVVAE